MPQEFHYFQQLLGAGSGWTQATLLAGLLAVLVFRPDRIRNRTLFLLACCAFALSMLVPPLWNLLFGVLGGGPWGRGGMGRSQWVMIGATASGPCLFGLSVLFALLSLMPGPPSPFQPPEHPLE